ncbi:MAG: hypothetical protein IPP19_10140 [Verrucomicrobia bacterium]|nr:hypothetical protein [Verrucomicrobiota bacterium]
MTPVSCHYCGLPFKVRRVEAGRDYFCCTGCAMLSRVPVDEKGQFPVNAHLVSALVTGFLFFNQLLFWLVAVLLVRDSKMEQALRFFWLSGGAALAVWMALAFLFWKERTARAADYVFMTFGLVALVVAFRRQPPWPLEMVVANVVLIVWSFRGLLRKQKG